jgi:enterochelin esterase-like enzyme
MASAGTGFAARWGDRIPGASGVRTLWLQRLFGIALALLVAGGLVGLYRYVDNYWLYRGYAPPKDPAWVVERGTTRTIAVSSPAVGGRRQQVIVYLPPGYASHPARRYPVFYLLHGSPGLPNAILLTVKAGVVEDELVARHLVRPMILVMPFGSPSRFTDTEWANGVGRASGWETFLARDVVRAIDARYRTIRSGAGRALGGLSEGGYGSLNIGLHHPREFHVLESWSGYVRADPIASVFGRGPARLRRNSPAVSIRSAGPVLRRRGATIWFYSSRGDPGLRQNEAFAAQLARLRVHNRFLVVRGGHDWRTWRDDFPAALLAASRGLGRG